MKRVKLQPEMLKGDLHCFKAQGDDSFSIQLHEGKIVCHHGETILDFESDFCRAMFVDDRMERFFKEFPDQVLIGEWDGNRFVVCDLNLKIDGGGYFFQNVDAYHHFLVEFGIHYRLPICSFRSPKDMTYVERIIDEGTWIFKNYGQQRIERWNIHPIK